MDQLPVIPRQWQSNAFVISFIWLWTPVSMRLWSKLQVLEPSKMQHFVIFLILKSYQLSLKKMSWRMSQMKTVFLLKPKSSKIKWYGMQLTHRMKSMRVEKKRGGGLSWWMLHASMTFQQSWAFKTLVIVQIWTVFQTHNVHCLEQWSPGQMDHL